MHDWILIKIEFIWEIGEISILLRDLKNRNKILVANGATNLLIPKLDNWGKSACINEVVFFNNYNNQSIKLEMQSGDSIFIEADNIKLPEI
jgi:hypothetical protein